MILTEKNRDRLLLITGHDRNEKVPGLLKKHFKHFKSTLFKNSVFVLKIVLKKVSMIVASLWLIFCYCNKKTMQYRTFDPVLHTKSVDCKCNRRKNQLFSDIQFLDKCTVTGNINFDDIIKK